MSEEYKKKHASMEISGWDWQCEYCKELNHTGFYDVEWVDGLGFVLCEWCQKKSIGNFN